MIISKAVDVEVFINVFSITFVDMKDYLQKFADCIDDKGNPLPLTECLTVEEIKARLDTVDSQVFWISDTDDSQLIEMVGYINNMQAGYITKVVDDEVTQIPVRYDLFGFNNKFQ